MGPIRPISIVEPDGTVVFANDAACTMLGRRRDELVGKKVFDLDRALGEPRWQLGGGGAAGGPRRPARCN